MGVKKKTTRKAKPLTVRPAPKPAGRETELEMLARLVRVDGEKTPEAELLRVLEKRTARRSKAQEDLEGVLKTERERVRAGVKQREAQNNAHRKRLRKVLRDATLRVTACPAPIVPRGEYVGRPDRPRDEDPSLYVIVEEEGGLTAAELLAWARGQKKTARTKH